MDMDARDKQLAHNQGILEKGDTFIEDVEQEREYCWQIRRYSALESIILVGVAIIATITLYYIFTVSITTRTGLLLYLISMAVAPSGLFLLFMHCYDLYVVYTKGKKLLPLLLDICYLLCVPLFTVTIFSLDNFFIRNQIPTSFLSVGWTTAVAVLFVELIGAYLASSVAMKKIIAPRFLLLFPIQESPFTTPYHVPLLIKKPMKHLFYFHKKPDTSLWELETSFVKLKP